MEYITIKFPSFADTMKSKRIYKRSLKQAEEEGLKSKQELVSQMIKFGALPVDIEKIISDAQSSPLFKYPYVEELNSTDEIENDFLEQRLIEVFSGSKMIWLSELSPKDEVIPDKYKGIKSTYDHFNGLKSEIVKCSREAYADSKRGLFLLHRCLFRGSSDVRVFKTLEDLENCKNEILVKLLSSVCFPFLSGMNSTVLRKISMHHSWRSRWASAKKTGQDLFGGIISEWDYNKVYLCYWSNFYDNVFESMDCPEEHILKDDEMLDNYLEQKRQERDNKSADTGGGDTTVARFKTRVNPVKKRK